MNLAMLRDICRYRNENTTVDSSLYVSTESMLSNKAGITTATPTPEAGKARRFRKGDTLVSNIRPYFKKVWQATVDGCCSADVLVFEPINCDADYLYWLLSSDSFFDYVVATSKGTKMPRGDKDAIMSYKFTNRSIDAQLQIGGLMNPIRGKLVLNSLLNDYLAA